MKKFFLLIVCFSVSTTLLCACSVKQKAPTINYKRKLEKYFPSDNQAKPANNMIDLSEGPKLRYDANFGPRDLNFDIKIINPY